MFCIDRDVEAVAELPEQLGTRLHVAGRVESLPYLSCHFDVVTASANLHRFAPGLALSEIARVLKPGGVLAVAYNVRDDTVPWVKRLAAILQQVDSSAMAGDYGLESLQAVADSPYFGEVSQHSFRNWVPIGRYRPDRHGRTPTRDRAAGQRRAAGPAERGRRPLRHVGATAGAAAAALPRGLLARPGRSLRTGPGRGRPRRAYRSASRQPRRLCFVRLFSASSPLRLEPVNLTPSNRSASREVEGERHTSAVLGTGIDTAER